jgi:RNA-binding protein
MPLELTNAQKRYLRGLAHSLKPVVLVGAKGVSDALLAEFELALEQHELLKVRVAAGDRDLRDAWLADMSARTGASLVGRIGHTAVFYRRRRENPLVILPKG